MEPDHPRHASLVDLLLNQYFVIDSNNKRNRDFLGVELPENSGNLTIAHLKESFLLLQTLPRFD